MSDFAIRVQQLGKQYEIGEQEMYRTLRDSIADFVTSPFRRSGRQPRADNRFWALQDITFDVKHGELIGIIGRNGAGKSTLLKVLSRITEPTTGRAEIRGRVGSLLEVGTGFHPELTGRENIYFNGAILGMRKVEITRKLDAIIDFAGIDQFVDTPVRRYSTGMYMRLAFAVAAHLETDILFVDEVLAVGDAEFQKKCLNKMQAVGSRGKTIFFVSHNMTAIRRLCQKAVWLDRGQIVDMGPTANVVAAYLRTASVETYEQVWDDPAMAPGNEAVRIKRATVRPLVPDANDQLSVSTPIALEFEYWNLEPGARLNLSLCVFNEEGVMVFNTGPVNEPEWHGKPFAAGLYRSVCYIPGDLLNDGMYRVTLLVVKDQSIIVYQHEEIISFEVHENAEKRNGWLGKWPGALRPDLKWTTEPVRGPAVQVRHQ